MGKSSLDVRGLYKNELIDYLAQLGEKSFRGKQIFRWVQAGAVQKWSEMTNLSNTLQDKLSQNLRFSPLKLILERVSCDGTRKYLLELEDGKRIESVLLFHGGAISKKRTTLCISTQVGCPMGCEFCATGKMGFVRNLTAGEIVGQVLDLTYLRKKEDQQFKINNLVYMGMGEPLLNLPEVLKSIRILNHEEGQKIGIRRITVSTCGLVPQIESLAEENIDIVLAVSLHAPNDKLRNEIMPVNKQYPLGKLINSCRRYIEKTGRRVTFEYALVKGFNDNMEQVVELSTLLRGIKANINVIPINTVSDGAFNKPSSEKIKKFVVALREKGLDVVIREEKGSDIEAACGQLAGSIM